MERPYKYFAFISYSSKDTKWGKRLQRKLENYRMPAKLCSEHGWKRTPIKPVFFAPTDIQPGGLTEELQERLRASRNLIVICSPNSAKSEWVGKEIEFFHQIGRTKQIHFFIVDGTPHSRNPATDCFNPIVKTLGLPEILGANIHEKVFRWSYLNKERAYAQLISKLLGVEFNAVWQRHKRLLIQNALMWLIGIVAVLAALVGVWMMSQPVDVEMRLNEISAYNENLPPLKEAIVTMALDNETKADTIHMIDGKVIFTNIPHKYLGKKVKIQVRCRDFLPTDTILSLSKLVTLNIKRDEAVYGNIHFRLWDLETGKAVPNTQIVVAGQTLTSDTSGLISLFVPLESQQHVYVVSASIPLVNDSIHLPCGENDVLQIR